MNLTDADQHHLKAADGWLELGDHLSAFEELEQIEPLHRAHPNVLKLRWRIYAKAKKWDSALAVADGLTTILPNDPAPFIWRSYSVRRTKDGGVQRAYDLLKEVADRFPDFPLLPFNLACYACQSGDIDGARHWLKAAFEIGEKDGYASQLKELALDEKDLKPLWLEVQLWKKPRSPGERP